MGFYELLLPSKGKIAFNLLSKRSTLRYAFLQKCFVKCVYMNNSNVII